MHSMTNKKPGAREAGLGKGRARERGRGNPTRALALKLMSWIQSCKLCGLERVAQPFLASVSALSNEEWEDEMG